MRIGLLVVTLGLIVLTTVCVALRSRSSRNAPTAFALSLPASANQFEKNIKPIFQARCQPCHLQGGQVYEKLPFDKAETITRLGTKLFTRIKDEKERRVIQDFLNASK